MFGRKAPYFCAFDILSMNGTDLRELALLTRKSRLFDVLPPTDSRVRYVDYIYERGTDFSRWRARTTWKALWPSGRMDVTRARARPVRLRFFSDVTHVPPIAHDFTPQEGAVAVDAQFRPSGDLPRAGLGRFAVLP